MVSTPPARIPFAAVLPLIGTGVAFISLLSVGFAITGSAIMAMM